MTLKDLIKEKQEEFDKKFEYANENPALVGKGDVQNFLSTFAQSIARSMAEEVRLEKKRMDVSNIGADSVSFPTGEIWTQEKREGYNYAKSDQDAKIKAFMGEE